MVVEQLWRIRGTWGVVGVSARVLWIKPGAGTLQIHASPTILCAEPPSTLPQRTLRSESIPLKYQ
jgi:hypothetical protein